MSFRWVSPSQSKQEKVEMIAHFGGKGCAIGCAIVQKNCAIVQKVVQSVFWAGTFCWGCEPRNSFVFGIWGVIPDIAELLPQYGGQMVASSSHTITNIFSQQNKNNKMRKFHKLSSLTFTATTKLNHYYWKLKLKKNF